MKTILATLIICSMATPAIANIGDSPKKQHPLYGKWTWTYQKNNCTEVYDFRSDNTKYVTSGEEVAESSFTISDSPDSNGFYQMTDEVTKSNGKTGCDGAPGGTPVGDTVTIYIFFHPIKNEMAICYDASFKGCFGPLRRVSDEP